MAFPSDYTKYQPVTIDYTKVSGTSHTDFTMLLDLLDLSDLSETEGDLFDTCRSDGGDIRITTSDGTTQLARDLVSIDTTAKTGIIWVKIPTLLGSVDTEIYVWYNGDDAEPAADSTYGAENAWANKYKLVLHMNQDPSGTTPQMIDSTSNDNSGTASSGLDSSDLINGRVGKCLDLSDSGALVTVPDNSTLDITGELTVQAWAERGNVAEYGGIVAKIEGYSNASFSLYVDESNYLALDIATSGVALETVVGTHSIRSVAGFRKVTGVFIPSTSMTLYLDGSQEAQRTNDVPSAVRSDISDVWIGADYDVSQYPFSGSIDEVRIIAGAVSADFEKTEYNNQSSPDTFYSVRGEIDTDEPTALPINGQSVSLIHNKIIVPVQLPVLITGHTIGLLHNKALVINPQAVDIAGKDVDFIFSQNPNKSPFLFYIFTLTGGNDGTTDIEIPISSFQARLRSGSPTYLSVTIPGLDHAAAINNRPNGLMKVDAAYKVGDDWAYRKTIIQSNLEDIYIYDGTTSRSITLTGHKQKTYESKAVTLTGQTYKSLTNGKLLYRFVQPNVDLNPGDTVTVNTDIYTADIISYYVRAKTGGIQTQMEVSES